MADNVPPQALAFQSLKTYCVKVKGLLRGNANANEFSFNHDQVCLHFINGETVKILIRFNHQSVNCCEDAFLINMLYNDRISIF